MIDEYDASLEPLAAALNEADSLPFLFVGSGVSRRYLGHERWDDLLRWAAGLTKRPFEYYFGRAQRNLPRTASLIAEEFYEIWWDDSRFEASRDKWSSECTGITSPLKIEVASKLSSTKPLDDKQLKKEMKLLASCQVDGILTTNYDGLLEKLFPSFSVFIGQEDLLLRRSYQLAEIYKIHGSVSEPDSLVLCDDDYGRFKEESAYLVSKLTSVFVEHPIVFIGYSLSDPNVRTILTSLVKCLSPERVAAFRDRFIWVDYDESCDEPAVDDHVIDLGDARFLPVLRVKTGSLEPVFKVLASLERVLPVEVLRRVEECIVEIVRSADPTRQIRVSSLDEIKDAKDVDVVVGVGLTTGDGAIGGTTGYKMHTRRDIIADVLRQTSKFQAKDVVETTLPIIMHQAPNAWVPVHRYVSQVGKEVVIPPEVQKMMNRIPVATFGQQMASQLGDLDMDLLEEEHGLAKALNLLLSVKREMIDLEKLRKFLAKRADKVLGSGDANTGTAFAKAVVLYDILRFGGDPEAQASH